MHINMKVCNKCANKEISKKDYNLPPVECWYIEDGRGDLLFDGGEI
jgi:hypothetical protein